MGSRAGGGGEREGGGVWVVGGKGGVHDPSICVRRESSWAGGEGRGGATKTSTTLGSPPIVGLLFSSVPYIYTRVNHSR